jgi:hypothetical protein
MFGPDVRDLAHSEHVLNGAHKCEIFDLFDLNCFYVMKSL